MKNMSSRTAHDKLHFFWCTIILLTAISFSSTLLAGQDCVSKPSPKPLNLSSTTIGDPKSVNSNPSIHNPKFEKSEVMQKTQRLRMPFIANEGQTDEKVSFYANTFGGTVFVTKDGEIVYALPNNSLDVETQCLASLMHSPNGIQDNHVSDIVHPASWIVGSGSKSAIQNLSPTSIGEPKSGVALREEFVGAKVKAIQGEDPSVTKVNYFKGSDPEKWKTDISTYDMVNLGEIYEGIDLKLKAYGNNVEKLFCVKPGANPEQIKISLSGIQPSENPPPLSPSVRGTGGCPPLAGAGGGVQPTRWLWVNEHGELVAETELGPVKFTKPVAYQEINGKRVDVSVEYRVESSEAENKFSKHKTRNSKPMSTNPKSAIQNPQFVYSNLKSKIANRKLEYGFIVASYDKTRNLIIDPLLASTFLGKYSTVYDRSITIDLNGNIYVTGETYSSEFPTTTGAFDTSYNGNGDIFISKLNGDLTSLLASTILGGSSYEGGRSIAIDSSGNIYVAGGTYSSDFPTTTGTYDTSYNGSYDVFVSKLNGSLTNLLASTYLGGSSYEDAQFIAMAIDSGGNIYVTGQTESSDFPATTGAYDTSHNGLGDTFISKLDGALTNLLASTYLGGSAYSYGSNDSDGYSIAIDSDGNVYVAGHTTSSDFPTTTGAYDTSYNGGYNGDTFIAKLNGVLTSLLASTYLGGSSRDAARSIAIDSNGNVYVTGDTWSSDFPTSSGAYDTSYNSYDVFISKLNVALSNLLASTYLGGSSSDDSQAITIDSDGNIYVAGKTFSSNFPTITGAFDTSYNGNGDVFVSKLNQNLTSLIASTILGGTNYENGSSIAIDSSGNIYVAGGTLSSDFPTTTGVYDTSYDGGSHTDELTGVNYYNDTFISKFDSNLSASTTLPPTPSSTPSPTPSPSPTPTAVTQISSGGYHCLSLKPDGTVWAWGSNDYGELGDGTTTYRSTPVQVSSLSGVIAVAGGMWHSLAVKSDGTVWAWGRNDYGGLGDGTTANSSTPVQVSSLSSVTAVAAGDYHSLALKPDGTVWAWGYNVYGQLGDGTTTNRSTPVQVSSLSGVTAVAAGDYHSLALKSDGTVWAWGYNVYGQLGDGTTTNRSTLVQVSSLSGVIAIAGGWDHHSLAVKSDGTVYTWGRNDYGQLGDGTKTDRSTPVQVSSLSGVIAVAGGTWHSLAVKSGGTVWAWGRNDYGQLGDGTKTDRSTPTQVNSLSGVIAVAGGGSHSLAVKSDGTVWAWGYNAFGQLGDGTTTQRSTPVQVRDLSLNTSATPTPSPTPSPKATPSPTPTSTTTAVPTPSPTTSPEEQNLLEKYAPILYMHPDERFYPTNVQKMLDNSELCKIGEAQPILANDNNELQLGQLMNYDTEDEYYKYYLRLKEETKKKIKNKKNKSWKNLEKVVYGRLFTDDDTNKTVLQYWFFYIYNDWGKVLDIANTHEGDWEMYQIILGSDNQPLLITYSFHLGGQTFQWSDEEVGKSEDGNHPLVYVALGGHGSWNKGGNHIWYQKLGKCLKCKDETKKGDVLYPPNFPEDEIQTTYSKYSYTLVKMSDWKENDWIYWNGYWGNQIVKGFSGPSSPPYIDYIDDGIDSRWKKPILWATSPNPSDYEICTSSNINVIARDEKRNIVRIIKKCSPFTKIIYSEKDLIFDVYSLDGEDVNLKISRYDRVTRSTHEVEFDWLTIPKNGKATLRFSPEQNPNLEMEIDHDHDGIFDYRVSPNYTTQNP